MCERCCKNLSELKFAIWIDQQKRQARQSAFQTVKAKCLNPPFSDITKDIDTQPIPQTPPLEKCTSGAPNEALVALQDGVNMLFYVGKEMNPLESRMKHKDLTLNSIWNLKHSHEILIMHSGILGIRWPADSDMLSACCQLRLVLICWYFWTHLRSPNQHNVEKVFPPKKWNS